MFLGGLQEHLLHFKLCMNGYWCFHGCREASLPLAKHIYKPYERGSLRFYGYKKTLLLNCGSHLGVHPDVTVLPMYPKKWTAVSLTVTRRWPCRSSRAAPSPATTWELYGKLRFTSWSTSVSDSSADVPQEVNRSLSYSPNVRGAMAGNHWDIGRK